MELIETHAHLDFSRYNHDREEVVERAREEGINKIIDVGADLASSRRALELSQTFSGVYAAVGIHPHDADKLNQTAYNVLKDLAKADRVVAVGEIGLDYYYDNSPRGLQKEAFTRQMKLARETGLPVIIHSREADEDTLEILNREKVSELGGVMHCFGSGLEMAGDCLELGLYLAFGGVITFKNADSLREVVSRVPLERILLETDSPYLTPTPHRGKRNEPSYIKFVAEKVAEIKGITLEEVAEVTTANARKLFGLKE